MKRYGAHDLHNVMLKPKAQHVSLCSTYHVWISTASACPSIWPKSGRPTLRSMLLACWTTGHIDPNATCRIPTACLSLATTGDGRDIFGETFSESSRWSQCVSRRAPSAFRWQRSFGSAAAQDELQDNEPSNSPPVSASLVSILLPCHGTGMDLLLQECLFRLLLRSRTVWVHHDWLVEVWCRARIDSQYLHPQAIPFFRLPAIAAQVASLETNVI